MSRTASVNRLIVTLGRLAAPHEEQESYLSALGVSPLCDELALEFEEDLVAARPFLDSNVLQLLNTISDFLDAMSGRERADLWTFESLEKAPEWSFVRNLSRETIELMPEATVD